MDKVHSPAVAASAWESGDEYGEPGLNLGETDLESLWAWRGRGQWDGVGLSGSLLSYQKSNQRSSRKAPSSSQWGAWLPGQQGLRLHSPTPPQGQPGQGRARVLWRRARGAAVCRCLGGGRESEHSAAGASLQLHLICPWQWEPRCGWNAEQHQGEGAGRWLPDLPYATPVLQLRPRAFSWGRERQEFISGPWKRRKGRAENRNPGAAGDGGTVGMVFFLRRGWNSGTRDRGIGIAEGPTGIPRDPGEEAGIPQRRGRVRGVGTEIPPRLWRGTGILWSTWGGEMLI